MVEGFATVMKHVYYSLGVKIHIFELLWFLLLLREVLLLVLELGLVVSFYPWIWCFYFLENLFFFILLLFLQMLLFFIFFRSSTHINFLKPFGVEMFNIRLFPQLLIYPSIIKMISNLFFFELGLVFWKIEFLLFWIMIRFIDFFKDIFMWFIFGHIHSFFIEKIFPFLL